MAASEYVQRLIDVARKEESDYGQYDEIDPPLEKRIRQYCRDLNFENPGNIRDFAWSATFVSWCLFTAGARDTEFKFHIRHAVFIKWAIQNQDKNTGLFRAHRIDEYAPQLGDLIANNRNGGKITYDEARENDSYFSHSAIVVDFKEIDGVPYAITIGGNEGNSIRDRRVALTKDGKVKQRQKDPFICVIENKKQKLTAEAIEKLAALNFMPGPGVVAKIPAPTFRKHGTFIYDANETIHDYGSIPDLVAAMQRAQMSHAWMRIHGQTPYPTERKKIIKDLIKGLQDAGIGVAGWGWCQGANAKGDAQLALQELKSFGLKDYLADIEHGVSNANWTTDEIRTFCSTIRDGLAGSFGITTFPLIDWHAPELMRAAMPFVDIFAPQVYWFNFPNSKMVTQFQRPDGSKYKPNNPVEYAELCLDRWTKLLGGTPKPLVITGQAYWGEGMEQASAEEKLEQFLTAWTSFGRVIGLNWWHFGGGTGMSHRMFEAIVAAELGKKSYA